MANSKPSILVVDDDAGTVRTTALILRRRGYAVATAQDGQEAIEKVKERPFDMIFMDIKMPAMDGVETYRRIKEIRPQAMVMMMMTAYAVEDLVQQALEEGVYGIFYKPLDIERVIATIEEARTTREGMLVLVVDDDPATCITLRNILARRSYEVNVAHTGEEAIAAAREKAYGIIFIDMKLPTINGLETYLAIREIDPQVVTIIITGYRQEMGDLVEEAWRNHAYTCLYKPFDIERLLILVGDIWEKKRGRQDDEGTE